MIYTVTVNPCLDYTLNIDELNIGSVNRPLNTRFTVGGKGINVSIMLKNLGVDSVALGFCGGFSGDELIRRLDLLGINNDFVRLKNGVTRVNVKLPSKTHTTEINADGPLVSAKEADILLEKITKLGCDDILVVSGKTLSGELHNIYDNILKIANKNGVLTIVDTSGQALKDALNFKPFLIKPNKQELCDLLNLENFDINSLEDYYNRLCLFGARNVLLTLGPDGAVLFSEEGKIFNLNAPKGTLKNPVAAGDSALAGFIAEYIKDRNFKDALGVAIAAGSATAYSDWIADKTAVLSLLKNNR